MYVCMLMYLGYIEKSIQYADYLWRILQNIKIFKILEFIKIIKVYMPSLIPRF
jgi:hypothetical protein